MLKEGDAPQLADLRMNSRGSSERNQPAAFILVPSIFGGSSFVRLIEKQSRSAARIEHLLESSLVRRSP